MSTKRLRNLAIRHHVTVLVVACSIGGLLLAFGIAAGHRSIDRDGREVGASSLTLRDIDALEQRIASWFLTCDLVLNASSYHADAAGSQTEEITTSLKELATAPLCSLNQEELRQLEHHVVEIGRRVVDSSTLTGPDRQQRLDRVITEVDTLSGPLILALDTLTTEVRRRADEESLRLEERRRLLTQLSWLGGLVYVTLVVGSWRWTVVTLNRPLQSLTSAAVEALGGEAPFRLRPEGPQEVRQLTSSVSCLVASLESALERVETRRVETEELVTSISAVLVRLGEDGRILRWNAVAEEIFGISATDAMGCRLDDCGIEWRDDEVFDELIAAVRSASSARFDELPFTDDEGRNRFLGVTLNPVHTDTGGRHGCVLLGQDVTERVTIESQLRQAQKLESVGQLAAGIAHEINTPIQFMSDTVHFLQEALGERATIAELQGELRRTVADDERVADLLARLTEAEEEADVEFLDEEIPRALERAIDGVARVSEIVQAMKRFSHPGATTKAPHDLNEAIQTTLAVARSEYKDVAEVELELGSIPPVECLLGDVNQVVLNLIVNAAHAVEDRVRETGGRGRIDIRTRREGDEVVIEVGDTGTGIPEEIRGRIFDPFFTTKDVGKGSGQGLALIHNTVVHGHGGQLDFTSELGKGTTFTVRLPIGETSSEPVGAGATESLAKTT
ncbi:MAG: ATP-binding protein [Acidobacteriota bacterium]